MAYLPVLPLRQVAQELAHHLESVAIIEVVAVDNGKWFVDDIFAHHHGVVGPPRFRAAFRASETFRKSVEALEHHFAWDVAFIFCEDNLAGSLLRSLYG